MLVLAWEVSQISSARGVSCRRQGSDRRDGYWICGRSRCGFASLGPASRPFEGGWAPFTTYYVPSEEACVSVEQNVRAPDVLDSWYDQFELSLRRFYAPRSRLPTTARIMRGPQIRRWSPLSSRRHLSVRLPVEIESDGSRRVSRFWTNMQTFSGGTWGESQLPTSSHRVSPPVSPALVSVCL